MKVPDASFKECFDFGMLRLIDRMNVDPTFVYVAVAIVCKVDWYALGLHD